MPFEWLKFLHVVTIIATITLAEGSILAPPPDKRVRHWFAWPGAAIAAFRLLEERGQLEQMLAVRLDASVGR